MTIPYSCPWQCVICGEKFIAREGELHHCPGSRAPFVPPANFEPLPIAMYRAGKKFGEMREREFLRAMGIDP
jgi:hypothetical protein